MIVAIDGPAGAGKSVLARKLANALQYGFLDTGAMYRAATLACLQAGIDLNSADDIATCAMAASISFVDSHVFLNGDDVSQLIRTPEVSRNIRPIADHPEVRHYMVDLQRNIVGNQDYVTEGRDQATVAFPYAECKIYLTASPQERANRRKAQLAQAGIEMPLEVILADQEQRDFEDSNRLVGALRVADDAIYVHTDGMKEEDVLRRMIDIVRECRMRTINAK